MKLYSFMQIFLIIIPHIVCQEDELKIVSKARTTFLEKYLSYINTVIVYLEVPKDSKFAAFQFIAEEIQASIFGCSSRKVSIYMKYGALPVINPDGSEFPPQFINITRSRLHHLEILSDKSVHYLNLTSPQPGPYYIATFLSYSDPNNEPIKPQGLVPKCFTQLEVNLFTNKLQTLDEIVDDSNYTVEMGTNSTIYYKFYVPSDVDHALLILEKIQLNRNQILIRIEANKIPSVDGFIAAKIVQSDENSVEMPFNAEEDSWHFLQLTTETFNDDSLVKIQLRLKFFYYTNTTVDYDRFGNALSKIYNSDNITQILKYKQYNLLRESTTESYSFAFDLEKQLETSTPTALNLTNDEFVTLKFLIRKNIDIGGSIQLTIAFKPRLTKDQRLFEHEPDTNQIIGCIRKDSIELPQWPNYCNYNQQLNKAPLIINKTMDNATIEIPFPESGVWFVTFKLYCNQCVQCECTDKCQQEFNQCRIDCERNCIDMDICNNCSIDCKEEIIKKQECEKCNCDGTCLIQNQQQCNSSMLFDISSFACTSNMCGRNGKCMFMVSHGIVYTTCSCSNNYRGWDCSDDSLANPYWLIILELLLLVLSNLAFLPTVYVAYKRKFYIEAIAYFSICFFSTFYHACDAGEHIFSMCITKLSSLQFADFFCALLSIWVTLIAIADLPLYWPSICHILGAIILAFITTINKTSVWVFFVPSICGLLLISISWYMKYRKVKQRFINKRYLYVYVPLGVVVVTVALIIFATLQTTQNYKYLHSLWHILMAMSVIVLLPRLDTFKPEETL